MKGPAPKPLAERLTAKLVRDATGCLLWTGGRCRKGYGSMSMPGGGRAKTHRVAYELAHGPIPEGMYVCHSCDTPACCEPTHLFLGSPTDNVRDMVSKNRHAWRDGTPWQKVNAEQVREIQALGRTSLLQREIADMYGISRSQRMTQRRSFVDFHSLLTTPPCGASGSSRACWCRCAGRRRDPGRR